MTVRADAETTLANSAMVAMVVRSQLPTSPWSDFDLHRIGKDSVTTCMHRKGR